MSTSAHLQLHAALSHDLNKPDSASAIKVVDDAGRKTFTVRQDGAILEFPYKQSDKAFWSGVKYYGSGMRSNIRLPRTQGEVE
jgi:uncharacterized protein GlcG (DUF336 family)